MYCHCPYEKKMIDVLPLTLVNLVQKCFFSEQTLLRNMGHVLITKIGEARIIRQTWSIGLTGRPNKSDRLA
jgi:hypothetical protein